MKTKLLKKLRRRFQIVELNYREIRGYVLCEFKWPNIREISSIQSTPYYLIKARREKILNYMKENYSHFDDEKDNRMISNNLATC